MFYCRFISPRKKQSSVSAGMEIEDMLDSSEFTDLKIIRICGLMGMATFTSDTDQVRHEFRSLYTLFCDLKKRYFNSAEQFREISMGMSGDYGIAAEEGSTIVRVGSLIFGERTKPNPMGG